MLCGSPFGQDPVGLGWMTTVTFDTMGLPSLGVPPGRETWRLSAPGVRAEHPWPGRASPPCRTHGRSAPTHPRQDARSFTLAGVAHVGLAAVLVDRPGVAGLAQVEEPFVRCRLR